MLALILIFVLVVLIVLIILLILVAILVILLILVIHLYFLQSIYSIIAARIECPDFQDLSFGLNIKLTINPAKTAMAIPPAAAFNPPVKIPKNPCALIASRTPFASVYPKPVRGTVAPAPANSTNGL